MFIYILDSRTTGKTDFNIMKKSLAEIYPEKTKEKRH
jgi:hypothetical protein